MSEGSRLTASTRPRFAVTCAGLTDVGRQRKHNEDHVLIRPEADLFVVADGMGGHNAGDVASKLATTSLGNFYEATQNGDIPTEGEDEEDATMPDDARRLAAAIRKANHDVFEISSTFQQHQGMGSTVVAAQINRQAGLVHVGHVGDSRCYRVRAGSIEQLTRDHSLVNDALAMKPDLTEDELARLPKNIITRALGMKELVKVDIRTEPIESGDTFLLCSDGLSGMVPDEEILEIVNITDDLAEACELLISMANDAGGSDNITAVLFRAEQIEGAADSDAEAPDSLPPEIEATETDEEDEEGELERCATCGHEIYIGNSFCVECGTPV